MNLHNCFKLLKATTHNVLSGLSDAQKMTSPNFLYRARDYTSGYSYNGSTTMSPWLIRLKNLVNHTMFAGYPDQLARRTKHRLDEPNTSFRFASFLTTFVQTFLFQSFEADLKSSAVLRMVREKLNANMIVRCNQRTVSHALSQPNINYFAVCIDSNTEVKRAKTSAHNGIRKKSGHFF